MSTSSRVNARWHRQLIQVGLALLCSVSAGLRAGTGSGLCEVVVRVTPAAAGQQFVRGSLPLPSGFLREGQGLTAETRGREFPAAVRVLTWHPTKPGEAKSARRAMVSFPYSFQDRSPVAFVFKPGHDRSPKLHPRRVEVRIEGELLQLDCPAGPRLSVRLLAPARTIDSPARVELVESNAFFVWQRFYWSDPQWPRMVEVRVDALGGVVVVGHLQRDLPGDGRAPDFGWEIETRGSPGLLQVGGKRVVPTNSPVSHFFTNGEDCAFTFGEGQWRIGHPTAPLKRRGRVEVHTHDAGRLVYRYWRCTATERVPMQQTAWHRAEFVLSPAGLAPLTATLEAPHEVQLDWQLWNELYASGPPLDLSAQPTLAELLRYHRDALLRCMAVGDDWGNVTSCTNGRSHGTVLGMNRLNHCPPMFAEAWRTGDRRWREVALLWCDNFYDQSIWWGEPKRGGTRYNNVRAQGHTPPDDDQTYMWRSNDAVHFCTKGYDAFFLAHEETGDPRMLEALAAQTAYAAKHVHVLDETRNVGDVRDFVRLYQYTGDRAHLDQALRLFREYRSVLSTGDLTDQRGKPIESNPPFIDDDVVGKQHPFAKPYIIGYALAGLPDLIALAPGEPKLRDVVRATADFLAASQDPVGGWRYPHPRSSRVVLGHSALEHAWQLSRSAAVLGPDEKHLDAIERVLRLRILAYRQIGRLPSLLESWELATGKVKELSELYQLYQYPADRDYFRDYTEGKLILGVSDPEGLVYFAEVLRYYLQHRPATRLLRPPSPDEPLGKFLARLPRSEP